jgi:histidyl-tRNA synthetase
MSTGTRSSPASFLKHATDVASFYGFVPVRSIEKSFSRTPDKIAHLAPDKSRGIHSFARSAGLAATYASFHPQEPVLTFHATPQPLYAPHSIPLSESGEFGLQVVGTNESVGEIVLLKTITMILAEWGSPVSRIRINALGDKDSQQRFGRELQLHVRKHLGRIDASCTHMPSQDPLSLYRCSMGVCREIIAEGPRPVHFLSEKSRVHFRSVLENLEKLGLPYEIDDLLLGDEKGPHITFAVDLKDEDATVFGAYGGRFDEYLRREARRKDSAGVGASIFFRKKGSVRSHFAVVPANRRPKIYFAQLGLRAKLQGLHVVDMFREAKVPVMQSFDSSKLSMQLSQASAQGVSHLVIMGQREALDGTVIVRTMQNSSQVTVPVSEVPRFLKTLRA